MDFTVRYDQHTLVNLFVIQTRHWRTTARHAAQLGMLRPDDGQRIRELFDRRFLTESVKLKESVVNAGVAGDIGHVEMARLILRIHRAMSLSFTNP